MMISVTHSDNHVKTDITLCDVVIPDDIKWLQQWNDGLDAGCLIPFYESIHASSFIQSMMAWDNEQPVLQVDICEAMFDDLGASELIGAGDYTLRFQFSPQAPAPVICHALYNCIEYVFLEKRASRIFIQVHKSNKILVDWIKDVRLTLTTEVVNKPQTPVCVLTK